jgi:bacterioferritin-associated ferredoxin
MGRNNMRKSCSCCNGENKVKGTTNTGEYVCYCSKVTEKDIKTAIRKKGAITVDQVISITGAMTNCNCEVNNPKGTCCYPDIIAVFEKYIDEKNAIMNMNG